MLRGRSKHLDSSGGGVRKKPSLDFSLTGLLYVIMMLFMGLAAVNSQANLLFAVFGLMIGVLLVAGIISRLVLRRLEITRVFPEQAAVGQSSTIYYQFHNHKRFWPSLSVTVSELSSADCFTKQPQAYLLHVAARMTATVPMQVVPGRRGLHHFDSHQLSTSFPFGFIKRAVARSRADSLLVHPAAASVDSKLLEQCLSAEQAGARMRPRRGGHDEFFGVKEFRTGENPRWIYWKRSARTGTLVAREMSQVAPPRLLILVDTFLSERTAVAQGDVERAIAMAASLVRATVDQGLSVSLLCWSGDWMYVPASRGKQHVRDLLAVLSRLPLNASFRPRELLERGRQFADAKTSTILFTPRAGVSGGLESTRCMTIAAGSEAARRYFHFDPGIDFERAMPPDQQARIGALDYGTSAVSEPAEGAYARV